MAVPASSLRHPTIVGRAPTPWRRTVRGTPVEIRPGRHIDVAVHRGTPALFDAPRTTVFMLHGAGGNKDQWREQWRALIATGHDLVAYDMLGHGASPRPRGAERYSGEALLADAFAVLERWRGDRNVLIGHSYGAGLVLAMLARLAERAMLAPIAGAVLLGARLFRGAHPIRDVPLAQLRKHRAKLDEDFRRLAWHPDADPALVRHETTLSMRNSLAVYQALFVDPRWMDPAAARAIDVPVLVLAGDHDGLVSADDSRALAHALPRARFELVERAGHQLMLERPREVCAAIASFLGEVAPAVPMSR